MLSRIKMFALALAITMSSIGMALGNKFDVQIGGGVGAPLAPESFTEPFNMGYTLKVAAGYFVMPQLNLGLNLSHNHFNLNEDDFLKSLGASNNNVSIDGGNLSIFEIAGTARYYILSSMPNTNVYVLGGPGVAFTRISDITVKTNQGTFKSASESETDFMATGGIGVTQKLNSNFSLFIEGRYSVIFADENASYLPIRLGINF